MVQHVVSRMGNRVMLTSTCLMSREFLSKSLSTIRSACLDIEEAKLPASAHLAYGGARISLG